MRRFLHHWVFFVVGGALSTPYALLALLAVPLAVPAGFLTDHVSEVAVVLPLLVLVLIGLTALIPLVRTLEGAIVPVLLGGPAAQLRVAPARTVGARLRGVAWFLGHVVGGAAISLATVLGLPVAVVLVTGFAREDGPVPVGLGTGHVDRAAALPLAAAIPLVLVAAVGVGGRFAAAMAPALLGPGPLERLAELEARAAGLAERNRLAQELHDSLGHALTVTALQAAAARRVLHDDPTFAEQALDAITRTSRAAAAELDGVLGLLRDGAAAGRVPVPDLRGLPELLARHREAGMPLDVELCGDLAAVPGAVSREVYRVLQEGLTNAVRHGGAAPTSLRLVVAPSELTAQVRNAVPATRRGGPGRGGRGIAGIRERMTLLGGRVSAGLDRDGSWLLHLQVPTGPAR
ncbi:MAG TPA: histidine kinase [Jatrophihabitans sp.]|jgi:signal transduction histidine kinase|nr:histidine kinase [Jatrophihabitans sp.]